MILRIEDGALPRLRLYDRQGKLQREFSGKIFPADVQRAVEKLLR